jgi:cytochrome c-type protein NapB
MGAVALLVAPGEPIAAEADVFRTGPATLAIEPDDPRQRTAHPRTLRTFRFIRAFPGAPPRIPHALSPDEFRTGVCRTCHERGGYSRRFAAYVPVTPHPEMGTCQQCHVGEDGVVDLATADADPNARCAMCHGPSGGPPHSVAASTWPTTVWPALRPTTRDELPPAIPHDLPLRGNCLACHSGPAAVAEIRTSHPDRASCRQCHAQPDADAGPFTRTSWLADAGTGGAP